MFQLTAEEAGALRFQIGMSKGKGRGGRRYLPYVFTEQGVAMLFSVLRSKRAVQVNVEIMRAFVRLRRMLASNEDLARKLAALEKKYDSQFRVVFEGDSRAHGPVTAPKTQDRVSGEGTSSAVRKSAERLFPRFRNSENVEVPCWRCLSKTRLTLILRF